jgi:hypothetical protein
MWRMVLNNEKTYRGNKFPAENISEDQTLWKMDFTAHHREKSSQVSRFKSGGSQRRRRRKDAPREARSLGL